MVEFFEKQLKSELIYKGRIFDVTKDEVLIANGNVAQRDVVHHKGGVVVVAQENDKIILVKQYRYPVQTELWELPAGKLDKEGEDILSAAKRELLEETGFTADNWQEKGFIYSTPGFSSERLYLFGATGLKEGRQELEEDEFIKYDFFKISDIKEMIKNNQITDAKTICAIARFVLL